MPSYMFLPAQPIYPGQMHRVRRNLLNFVLVVDLGSSDGLAAAAAAHALIQQNLPIRWGILPANTSLRIRANEQYRSPHSAVNSAAQPSPLVIDARSLLHAGYHVRQLCTNSMLTQAIAVSSAVSIPNLSPAAGRMCQTLLDVEHTSVWCRRRAAHMGAAHDLGAHCCNGPGPGFERCDPTIADLRHSAWQRNPHRDPG